MVNSTTYHYLCNFLVIYNSRNLYGQFDRLANRNIIFIYNSRNLYGQFDKWGYPQSCFIYNSRNLYGQFDTEKPVEFKRSTTVEIYMVNSTLQMRSSMLLIYNSRNLYGQFDVSLSIHIFLYLQQ